jgi:hypothetical protein
VTLDRDLVSEVLSRPDPGPGGEPDGEPDGSNREILKRNNSLSARFAAARAARVASGVLHIIASATFGEDRSVACSCGATFAGRSDGAMASAFSGHAEETRRGSRSGPVERVPAREEEER